MQSRALSSRGQDDDRMGKFGNSSSEQSNLVTACSTDLESDQGVNLNFQKVQQDRQDVASEKLDNIEVSSSKVEENPEGGNVLGSTDIGSQKSNLPRDQHRVEESRMGFSEAFSQVGLLNSFIPESQEVPSPLKANLENAIPLMKPNTLVSPKKEKQPKEKTNWKKIARENGKQAQTSPTGTQVKLSGSKQPSRLDFSKETVGNSPS